MKTFYSLIVICALNLYISIGTTNAQKIVSQPSGLSTVVKNNVSAPASAARTTTYPKGDCSCSNNLLADPSFEDSDPFSGWNKSGTWSTDGTYAVCGSDAAVLQNAGSIYQDFEIVPGSVVNFTIWGGYHVFKSQTFKRTFMDVNKKLITADSLIVDWDVDVAPTSGPILKKYTFSAATAPAGTVYVRVEAKAKSGDWFKVDGGCLQITAPPISCGCDNNVLLNPSFENGITSWTFTKIGNGSASSNTTYDVCGSNAIVINGGGKLTQDVPIIGGTTATLTIYGGYHEKIGQKFNLIFLAPDGITALLTKTVEVDWDVDIVAAGQPILKQYSLTDVAPPGSSFVRVEATTPGPDFFKIDAACLKLTPAPCETCTGNQLVNPSFEDGVNSWAKTGDGTFATSTDYVVCGTKSAKITNKAAISQTKNIAPGNTVTWTVYAGYEGSNTGFTQTLKVKFFKGTEEITGSTVTQVIDKSVTAATVGLKKYTLTKQAPSGTTSVVLEISSSAGTIYSDLGCFLLKTDTPLPVTLTDFSVKKEGTAASLAWKTTAETNSKSFEVQHSLNGKEWAVLGSVDAQGESSVTKSYNYTHATPANGNNLYRLRMIDKDETFAYSRIISENFVTDESAVLYPNPSSNFMKLRNGKEKIASIQIYDIRGVKVKDFVPKDGVDVDISNLSSGSYIVTFKQPNGLITKQKITVIR
ncbi:T9SS type A sorting domain-containing protein [Dyadobacter sp. 3J3]|uniref:T9SS type A sorting domain-containing protein n=1 Tax=Dyadobacter sp. 3J3 TaxID=2606600 RepID=UPI001359154A|nr:T9SS type A sorting domain-containing protein [Dyadobacter sp. 3J3]